VADPRTPEASFVTGVRDGEPVAAVGVVAADDEQTNPVEEA
jgi:hypothetical protein